MARRFCYGPVPLACRCDCSSDLRKWGMLGVVNLDDEICYCYRVPMRKLVNFARRVRPARPSQMTECLGAGTGCGWCVPFLIKIAEDPDAVDLADLTPEGYAEQRTTYRSSGSPKNTFGQSDSEA